MPNMFDSSLPSGTETPTTQGEEPKNMFDSSLPSSASSQQDDSLSQEIPQDVRNAQDVTGSHDFDGLCEKFVEQMVYGHSNIHPTAVAAWNDNAKKGKAYSGLQGAKPGDPIYFAPDASNQGAGHAAIYAGNGKMISATDQGVRTDDVATWQKQTGQQLLGHVKPQ